MSEYNFYCAPPLFSFISFFHCLGALCFVCSHSLSIPSWSCNLVSENLWIACYKAVLNISFSSWFVVSITAENSHQVSPGLSRLFKLDFQSSSGTQEQNKHMASPKNRGRWTVPPQGGRQQSFGDCLLTAKKTGEGIEESVTALILLIELPKPSLPSQEDRVDAVPACSLKARGLCLPVVGLKSSHRPQHAVSIRVYVWGNYSFTATVVVLVLFLPSLLHVAAKRQDWGGNQALNTLTCSGKSSSSLPALTILRYLGFSSLSPYKNTTPFPHFVLYQSFIALGTIMEASHLGNSAVLLMDASSASWSHSFARLQKAAKTLCRCKLVGLGNSQQISTDQHWLGNPPQYLQSWKPKQHCLAPIHASAALFRAQPHNWSLEPTGRLKSMTCVKGSTVKTFVL